MKSVKQSLVGHARRLVSRLPNRFQAALRQLVRWAWSATNSGKRAASPLLTVVVVASNAESYLGECLKSLRVQTLKKMEVLVVDNASIDGIAAIAREVAAEDPRFQLLTRPELGVTALRNEGARLARGRFLAFVDATDTVPRTAYATLINSLQRTGSDFATGSLRTLRRGRRRRPPWDTLTHDLDRPSVTLHDFPLAVHDASATSRVFRKDFWDWAVGAFPDSVDGESFAIVRATLQARQFDLLQAVSCVRRTPLDQGKLLPDPLTLGELDSRLNWLWATRQVVRDAADHAIASAWMGGLIDGDLGDFAEDAHRSDDAYRARLQKAAQECLPIADDTVWCHVRVDRKLRLWLVANGRWADLEQLIQHVRVYGTIPRTEVRDGRLYAVAEEWPGICRSSAGVPGTGEKPD